MSRRRLRRLILMAGLGLLLAAAIFLHPLRVVSGSMRPAIFEGDLLLATRNLGFDPERGDLILVEEPDMEDLVIKRVAGLPGERIQIIGEDVFIDGERLVREISGVEELVPLVDAGPEDADLWFNLRGNGLHSVRNGWELAGQGSFGLRELPLDGFLAGGELQQGEMPAEDLGIEAGFRLESGDSRLEISIQEDSDLFRVVLEEGGSRLRLMRGAESAVELARKDLAAPVKRGTLFLANVDGVLTVSLNGEVIFREPYGVADRRPVDGAPANMHFTQVRVGGQGPILIISLRVGRDLSRRAVGTFGVEEGFLLGRDEYFVLGDHAVSSRDSRQFGSVSRDRIRGSILFRLWPPGRVGLGWGR